MTPVSLPIFFHIPESILNPVPIQHEVESPISYDHNSLPGKVCELQFLSLDPLSEQILTLEH